LRLSHIFFEANQLVLRASGAGTKFTPAVPCHNWTGFYIGGNLGAEFGKASYSDTFGNSFSSSTNTSFVGGGQLGVNYEFGGGVVIGAEAMFDWAPNSGTSARREAEPLGAALSTIAG
jgi:opacity protein-like surface antigen